MIGRSDTTQGLALRLLGWIGLFLAVLFTAETGFELWRSGVEWSSLEPTARLTQGLASTVSRAFNNLLAMVLSFVAIAVPITANMYTPRLIEIFFSDRVNLFSLGFFASMGAHAIFAQAVAFDSWAPRTHLAVLLVSGVVGFTVLIPYYLYVLDFLNPSTIIRRVRDRVTDEYAEVALRRRGAKEQRARVQSRILQLGNVILRAVDRADRDVAIDAISALESATNAWGEHKPSAPPDWFDAEADLFPGLSGDAIRLLRRERIWVEQRCLSQLLLAYNASFSKMPDAISAISLVARRVALTAKDRDDDAALGLAIRYFNTFVRAAVGRKDLHAVYDVFYEYRQLAIDLLAKKPQRSAEIARHFRYYAQLAKHQGLQFVYELGASEIAVIAEAAYELKAPTAGAVLGELRACHRTDATTRLTKAEAVLAAYFQLRELTAEFAVVRGDMAQAPVAQLRAARNDIAAATDAVFWEVTDRQTNLDYVPPERRDAVLRLLDVLIAEKSG